MMRKLVYRCFIQEASKVPAIRPKAAAIRKRTAGEILSTFLYNIRMGTVASTVICIYTALIDDIKPKNNDPTTYTNHVYTNQKTSHSASEKDSSSSISAISSPSIHSSSASSSPPPSKVSSSTSKVSPT